jgi:hypothetical protein
VSLGSGLLVAVVAARTVLPVAVRVLAKHATPELYQLTVVAFCLCSGWLSGYMVSSPLCCCCIFSLHWLHVGAFASWLYCEVCCRDCLEGHCQPKDLHC